ncbi:hypothetical protein M885DRAFT_504596 [Pelagophyceae sp. CCMP2097]|nr:hypothetical protein M885DRAFT_504596 [Pelagophyceae sp. CCMP2097]
MTGTLDEMPLMTGAAGQGTPTQSPSTPSAAGQGAPNTPPASAASAALENSPEANRGDGRPQRQPRQRNRNFLRLLSVSDPRVLFYLSMLVNLPQIFAAVLTFAISDARGNAVCDATTRIHWKIWGVVHVIRLTATTAVCGLRWKFAPRGDGANEPPARRRAATLVTNARNALDGMALVWFVVGNMWLLGGADDEGCAQAGQSPVYVACVAMLVVQYAQICLPCVCAMAMVPIFCFCLPCVIRLLATLHDPQRGRGANSRAISQLPTIVFQEGCDCGEGDPVCSVCISDYEPNEQLRLLPCKHAFHKTCVDQWLGVNATCPLCRTSIFADDDDDPEAPSDVETPSPSDVSPQGEAVAEQPGNAMGALAITENTAMI